MKILIVGGSVFLGRALTDVALKNGYEVSHLNRGQSSTEPASGVEHVRADRNGDLSGLLGRRWDAVIDTCAYFPKQVDHLLSALQEKVGHYTLISSVSAYADLSRAGQNEEARLGVIAEDYNGEMSAESYGPLKAACETRAQRLMPDVTLIVRPGFIVGPHDPTDRFAYWVMRLAAGGDRLAPGKPDDPLQIMDVRDLAAWIIARIERRTTGVFNAVGPETALTFATFLQTCAAVAATEVRLHWAKDEFFMQQKVNVRGELPLWASTADEKFGGINAIDGRKAWQAGLAPRALLDTVRDVKTWRTRSLSERPIKGGMTLEREQALLEKLRMLS